MNSITIERIKEIIDQEVAFAKKTNVQMAMGMLVIRTLLIKETEEKKNNG